MDLNEVTNMQMGELIKELRKKIENDRDLHPSEYLDEDVNLIYTIAHKYYTLGSFREAEIFFMRLVIARSENLKFWKGLASSRQMQDDFAGALVAWGMCAMLDEDDLSNHFYGIECLIKLDQKDQARAAFNQIIDRCTEDHALFERSLSLKKQLEE